MNNQKVCLVCCQVVPNGVAHVALASDVNVINGPLAADFDCIDWSLPAPRELVDCRFPLPSKPKEKIEYYRSWE